jgi:signal recognition particle subunit SRP54
MFDSIAKSLSQALDRLRGRSFITEADLDKSLREIRVALLGNDVPLPVITQLLGDVRSAAVGQKVLEEVSAGQMIVKIVHDTIVTTLGGVPDTIMSEEPKPPRTVLMVGLQGAGKTTSTAKLAHKYKRLEQKVLLVSLDVYRPAAIEQLAALGRGAGIDVLPVLDEEKAAKNVMAIVKRALRVREQDNYDVLLLDTAGRLNVDSAMMEEIKQVRDLAQPDEVLCVADISMGQSSYGVVRDFHGAVGITGIILTKTDGDASGGVALAMSSATGCPIKFVGSGEKIADLENFDPQRMADRILGMGDIVSLVEKAAASVDEDEAQRIGDKMKSGIFDFNDYAAQLNLLKNMGGLAGIMRFLPMGAIEKTAGDNLKEEKVHTELALIASMTKQERSNPDLVAHSTARKVRIAAGAGARFSEVTTMTENFVRIASVVKQLAAMDSDDLVSGLSRVFKK